MSAFAAKPFPAPSRAIGPQRHLRSAHYVVVNGAFHVVLFRHRGGAWAFRIEELETERAWCRKALNGNALPWTSGMVHSGPSRLVLPDL
jgi:hypothetical protein